MKSRNESLEFASHSVFVDYDIEKSQCSCHEYTEFSWKKQLRKSANKYSQ